MSENFRVNKYQAFMDSDTVIKEGAPDLTDQGMTKSVRQTLEQFARTGQVIDPSKSKFSYADEFADDEPLNSERIDNLLDRPDFTGDSEMEMMDFIRENTTETSISDLQKLYEQKKKQSENEKPKSEQPSSIDQAAQE